MGCGNSVALCWWVDDEQRNMNKKCNNNKANYWHNNNNKQKLAIRISISVSREIVTKHTHTSKFMNMCVG